MASNRHHTPARLAEPALLALFLRWLQLTGAAARHAFLRLFRSEDLTYASSIAYYALVSLFPLLLFGVSILGRFTDSETERAAVTELVLRFLPEQVDLVSNQLENLSNAGRRGVRAGRYGGHPLGISRGVSGDLDGGQPCLGS